VSVVPLRSAAECRYDVVALGEVMLRLDPGEGRIRTARSFDVWEGGGEYNVARGLCRTFGQRGAILTALADNEVGRLLEELILAGGLDTSFLRWTPHDGIGLTVRNGLNFTERGFGVRGAVGVYDRGHTAAAQIQPDDFDWDALFGDLGVRWLHTGGIFAGLSESTARTVLAASAAAKRHGTVVSYDLNYRPSLWQSRGGSAAAAALTASVVDNVDVLFGDVSDLATRLGSPVRADEATDQHAEADRLATVMQQVGARYPNLAMVGTTLRTVHSATVNSWGGLAWSKATGVVAARYRPDLGILDRVGGGDAFASGLIFGLLTGAPLATAVEYGAANGALAMTTPGDFSMASRREVIRLAEGGTAQALR